MALLTVENKNKLLIVGPLYNNINALDKVLDSINEYDLVILNGNMSYPFNKDEFKYKCDKIKDSLASGKLIYNIGDLDYKLSLSEPAVQAWIQGKPNVINIKFPRGINFLIVSGGILPDMTRQSLSNNIECSFVNTNWHKTYNNKFGYVISNHPLIKEKPTFYVYSSRIGLPYEENGSIYGHIIDQYGVLESINF